MSQPALLKFYVSPGHNFFGRHGKSANENPIEEKTRIHCVAGRGIEGDRFFDYKADYRGQITFFADETYRHLCDTTGTTGKTPEVFRRNVLTRGMDLNGLIGKQFTLQGVRFEGMTECKPCYWMDSAFGPGAEQRLKGRGGLRARILTTGWLDLAVAPALQVDPIGQTALDIPFSTSL